jgi:hypothetical protein
VLLLDETPAASASTKSTGSSRGSGRVHREGVAIIWIEHTHAHGR